MSEAQRGRAEWCWVALMTLVGAVLRLWSLDRLGLTHFDEGMYAMAAFWVTLPRGLAEIDPAAALYAPPGFVALAGLGYMLAGFADLVPIGVSILAGIAAVPLAGLLARRAFGPGAGASAAALAAVSGAHLAFSRMALTDALFLDAWMIVMAAGLRFLRRPGVGPALGLGLAVGLAQNVKYNGGLAGLIVGLAAAGPWIVTAGKRRAGRELTLLIGAALVAVVLYVPWVIYVEQHVGYARLAAHQRSYAGRLADWPRHLRTQLGQSVALSGGPRWGVAAGSLAVLGAGAATGRGAGWPRRAAIFTGTVGALAVLPTLPWWLGIAWAPRLIRGEDAGRRLVGCWLAGASAITAMYHPYARLWLPLHAAGWVVAAGAISGLLRPGGAGPGRRTLALAVLLATAQCWLVRPRPTPLPGLLGPTDSFPAHLSEASPDPATTDVGTLLLLARPHANFYLSMGGRVPFRKMSGLAQLIEEAGPGQWALVDDVMLRQEGDLDAARRRILERYEPVGGWTETLSPPTLLDVAPEAAFGQVGARSSRWTLMRPRSR